MNNDRRRKVILGLLLLVAGLAIPGDLRSHASRKGRINTLEYHPRLSVLGESDVAVRPISFSRPLASRSAEPAATSIEIVATPARTSTRKDTFTPQPSLGSSDVIESPWGDESFDTGMDGDFDGDSLPSTGPSVGGFAGGSGGGARVGPASNSQSGSRNQVYGDSPPAPGSSSIPNTQDSPQTPPTDLGSGGGGGTPCSNPGLNNSTESLVEFGGNQPQVTLGPVVNDGTIAVDSGVTLNLSQYCPGQTFALANSDTGVVALSPGAHANIAGIVVNQGTISIAGNDMIVNVVPGGANGDDRMLVNDACGLIGFTAGGGSPLLRCGGVDLVNRGAITGSGTIMFQGNASFDDQSAGACHLHDLRGTDLRFESATGSLEIGCKDLGNSRRGLDSVQSFNSLVVVNSTVRLVSGRDNEAAAGGEVLYVRTLSVVGSRLDLAGRTLYYKAQGPGGIDLQSVETNGGQLIKLATCPADFNGDDDVNIFDYLDFVTAFEFGFPSADFNHDGAIDFFDYDDFVVALETPC